MMVVLMMMKGGGGRRLWSLKSQATLENLEPFMVTLVSDDSLTLWI